MNKVIYKYQLELSDLVPVRMHKGGEVLSVQIQHDKICIWAKVNENESLFEERVFEIVGTGHRFRDKDKRYLATIQDGVFVWHIFETDL